MAKAKRVDLRRAHQALGRKAYETRVLPEKFAKQYDEIAALSKTVATECEGVKSSELATAKEGRGAFATSAKMKTEDEMPNFHLKQLYTQLGADLAAQELPDSCRVEIDAVLGIEVGIQNLEKELLTNSADKGARKEIVAALQALTHGKFRMYSVATLCSLLLLTGIGYRMLRTDGSQSSVQGSAEAKGKVAAVQIKVGGTRREPTSSSPMIPPSPSQVRTQNQTERDQSEKERLIGIFGEDGWRKQDPTERDKRERVRVKGVPIARNTGYKTGHIWAESKLKRGGYDLSAAPSKLQLDNEARGSWLAYRASFHELEDTALLLDGVHDAFSELHDAFKEAWLEGFKNGVVDVLKPEIERRKPAF
jgi:hypothetical protein